MRGLQEKREVRKKFRSRFSSLVGWEDARAQLEVGLIPIGFPHPLGPVSIRGAPRTSPRPSYSSCRVSWRTGYIFCFLLVWHWILKRYIYIAIFTTLNVIIRHKKSRIGINMVAQFWLNFAVSMTPVTVAILLDVTCRPPEATQTEIQQNPMLLFMQTVPEIPDFPQ